MNRDQVQGKVKDIAGKAEEKFGEATGSTEHQVKGIGKQVAGKTREGLGDVKELAKKADNDQDPKR